jgi:hypothetical protein
LLRVARSTTLVFITWSTSIQKSGANSFQKQHQQNISRPSLPRPCAAQGTLCPSRSHPDAPPARGPRFRAAVRACTPRTAGPSAAPPPYARRPSPVARRGIFAVTRRHPQTPQAAYINLLLPLFAPPRAAPPPLPPPPGARASTRARRRQAAPVAPLGTRRPPQVA